MVRGSCHIVGQVHFFTVQFQHLCTWHNGAMAWMSSLGHIQVDWPDWKKGCGGLWSSRPGSTVRDVSFNCLGPLSPPSTSPASVLGVELRGSPSGQSPEPTKWNSVSTGICPSIPVEMGWLKSLVESLDCLCSVLHLTCKEESITLCLNNDSKEDSTGSL